jgi:hypothetical protein
MKHLAGLLLLAGIFATVQLVSAAPEKTAGAKTDNKASDQVIAKIKKYREEGEQKLVENKLTRKEVSLTKPNIKESIRQKWEKMDAYYEDGKLVRIQLYPRPGMSQRTEQFYLMDDKLVFAFIQDTGPKHEGKDMGEPGKELYFHNDKLIKLEDRSAEQVADPEREKKMYQARLPYEISELVEILKKS